MVTQVHSRTDYKRLRKCCLFALTVNLHNNISSEYSKNQTLCKDTINGKIPVYTFLS